MKLDIIPWYNIRIHIQGGGEEGKEEEERKTSWAL
jgi:hypothetical protein